MEYPNLLQYPYIGWDTETTGLIYPVDRVFAFSISAPRGERSWYFDIRRDPDAVHWFNDQMSEYNGSVIAHNVAFDYSMSSVSGFKLRRLLDRGQFIDTVQQAVLINEHERSYELDDLCSKYLRVRKEDIWDELQNIFGGKGGKKGQIVNLPRAPYELAEKYGIKDAVLAVKLYEWQLQEIKKQGIHQIIENEHRWMPMFIKRKMHGIRVDLDYAEQAADKLTPIIRDTQQQLDKQAGYSGFNVNSSPQIKKLFEPRVAVDNDDPRRKVWETSDGTTIGTTPKGEPSLRSEFLREMSHPAAKLIVRLRSLIKTRDTFLCGHVLSHAHDSRVYPNINQNKGEEGGTATGRLSYTGPAMQQIPNRDKEVASIVKPTFLPEEGHIWCDTDLKSFEVRVFAHLINVASIIEQYKEDPDLDFHRFVGDLTGLVRDAEYSGQPNSKQLNLSMIFNQGDGATAQKMGMDWFWDSFVPKGADEEDRIYYKAPGEEARRIIDYYHSRVPGIKELQKGCKEKAKVRGYIFTRSGRRLRFPHGYGVHKASGLLIQATSADINKENWELIDNILGGSEGEMLLNTHDSYSFSFPEDDWKRPYEEIKAEIEGERGLRVPLILELNGTGVNWWEAIRKK